MTIYMAKITATNSCLHGVVVQCQASNQTDSSSILSVYIVWIFHVVVNTNNFCFFIFVECFALCTFSLNIQYFVFSNLKYFKDLSFTVSASFHCI